MVDVLFRAAFLLVYAAAWLLVFAAMTSLYLLASIAHWGWITARRVTGRVKARRYREAEGVQEDAALGSYPASLH